MTCHMGGNFDDFLSDDGLLEDCELTSQRRVIDFVKSREPDRDVVMTIKQIHQNLHENQGKLDPKIEHILRDNLWELYDS